MQWLPNCGWCIPMNAVGPFLSAICCMCFGTKLWLRSTTASRNSAGNESAGCHLAQYLASMGNYGKPSATGLKRPQCNKWLQAVSIRAHLLLDLISSLFWLQLGVSIFPIIFYHSPLLLASCLYSFSWILIFLMPSLRLAGFRKSYQVCWSGAQQWLASPMIWYATATCRNLLSKSPWRSLARQKVKLSTLDGGVCDFRSLQSIPCQLLSSSQPEVRVVDLYNEVTALA